MRPSYLDTCVILGQKTVSSELSCTKSYHKVSVQSPWPRTLGKCAGCKRVATRRQHAADSTTLQIRDVRASRTLLGAVNASTLFSVQVNIREGLAVHLARSLRNLRATLPTLWSSCLFFFVVFLRICRLEAKRRSTGAFVCAASRDRRRVR